VFPASDPNAGQLDLPSGYVTITAYDDSHSATGTSIVSIHPRATNITLTAPDWTTASLPTSNCVSQNQQVKYIANPVFGANALSTTTLPFDNDYTWSVGDANVATVSTHGYVIAHNPGVTNVYAKLNGTISVPLAFATCPPASIVLSHSPFTRGAPIPPFSTTDLSSTASDCSSTDSCILNNGDQRFFTITQILDANGNAMHPLDANGNPETAAPIQLPITYVSTDLGVGAFSAKLPLTEDFTAQASGRTTVMAACEPTNCNASVPDFAVPSATGPRPVTAKLAGFGYPVYSNVIGVTVQGTTGSEVLVTGTTFADGTTPIFRMLVYDSESLAITHEVSLANTPNSLVVAPNGLTAYVGSQQGLVVVNLSTFGSSLLTYKIVGGLSTDVVTGKVIGVSPDSRYVVISDTTDPNPANHLVFLIDTTGTRVAARFTIPGIHAVTFAPDGTNFWIGGDSGVYVYESDAFVHTLTNVSSGVTALAWTPDGQSYFASGNQLTNYSTCDDQNPQSPPIPTGSPINLSATAIGGVPQLIGLSSGSQWLDYSVTKAPPAGQTVPPGYVCSGTVAISTAAPTPSTLPCTAKQIAFSARLEQSFVTGVVDPLNTVGASSCANPDAFIHGFDVSTSSDITIPTADALPIIPLSGGVLSDGRKLYVGTYDSTLKTAALRRFDLTTDTEDVVTSTVTSSTGNVTTVTTVPATVELIPSFVAVVPK
jgi:hypothetical protein